MTTRLRRTFSSLRVRNYRLFFIGQLVSVSGTWMQTVAQSFLVLELTHSGTQLGLTTATRFLPMFALTTWGGVVADRVDKRRILYLTQTLSGVLAVVFGVLISTDAIRIWQVYVLAATLGLVNVFDNPARQSFISDLVPAEELSNAVTLNSVTVNVARVFGAALGGAVAAAVGLALCFDVNAVSFLAVLITLFLMTGRDIYRAERPSRRPGQIREGLRYVRASPPILVPLVMIAVVGTLAWEFQVSLPLLAARTFDGGTGTYGAMTAFMGLGAAIGGLISASHSTPRARLLSTAAIGWGIAIVAAAIAPTLALEYAVLLFVGYGSVAFNSLAKTSLQLASMPTMRGRVMSLWAVAWLGSTPIGGPLIGWIGEQFGARWSLLVGGVATTVVGVVALPVLRRIDADKTPSGHVAGGKTEQP